MKLKVQHSLRSLLVFIGVVCVIFAVVYSDRFLWVSSSATETPVSWMRNSSSMKSDFEYLWNNKHDPNIDRSEAVKNLRLLVSQEVPPESPASDIKKHIERHYRNPSFAFSGFLNDCWTQNAHGYPTVLIQDTNWLLLITMFGMTNSSTWVFHWESTGAILT